MIGLSPDTIDYKGISSVTTNGETIETATTVSGISCSVQENNRSHNILLNGSSVIYKFCIIITKKVQRDKLPTFNINDKVVYNSNEYKILSVSDLQMHTEIYI